MEFDNNQINGIKRTFTQALDTLNIIIFIKFILYPCFTLKQEITCIINNKHRVRSSIICSVILGFSILGIYLFYNNLTIYYFYNNLTILFNINGGLQQLLAFNFAFLSFAHLGNYWGNLIIKTYCKIFLGDANFYVSEKQIDQLIEQFHLQGYTNINKNHILTIIEFCKKNLNELDSKELGAKQVDWRQTLESLIYDANIEHFIDQQIALQNKKLEITSKIELIKYCEITEEGLNLAKINTNFHIPNTTIHSNLQCSIDESFQNIEREFDKFKENYLKNHNCANYVSRQQLLHQYHCYLNSREIKTSMGIYPTTSMEEILFNSFCDPYYALYSEKNSRNNSIHTIDNNIHQPSLDSDSSIIFYSQEQQLIIEPDTTSRSSTPTSTRLKIS